MGRCAKSLVIALAFATVSACDGGIRLPEPAEGPPGETPHAISSTLSVSEGEALDSQEVTGKCVWLYLWAQVDGESEWLPVAQNTMLVTADFRNEDGVKVFCELVGLPGPRTYELPISQVPDGWYVVCNLSDQCSEPFEKA